MRWVNLGLQLLPLIAGAVHAVERVGTVTPHLQGTAKQDLALELIHTMAGISTPGLVPNLTDPQVEQAIRALISAYVAVQNLLTARALVSAPSVDAGTPS